MDWNNFMDKIDRGHFPYLILMMTTNRTPEWFDALDPAYMRAGRVNMKLEIVDATEPPAEEEVINPPQLTRKVVIYWWGPSVTRTENNRIMDIVKTCGTVVEDMDNDIDHYLYVPWQSGGKGEITIYAFNRYDPEFIAKVEEAIATNPHKHCPGLNYEGHLFVREVSSAVTPKIIRSVPKSKYSPIFYEELE